MHGKKNKDLFSHYYFRRAIALAWIDPKNYWSEKVGAEEISISSNNTRKRKSIPSSAEQRQTRKSFAEQLEIHNKSNVVTDASLHPLNGFLSCRLVINMGHWPHHKVGHKRAKCALHHWAAQLEQRRHVFRCNTCKVHLCIECFEPFHTVTDLTIKKKEIANEMLRAKLSSNET